jgi:hexosaminidase
LLREWAPSQIKGKEFGELEINATGKVTGNGTYQLSFWYIQGASRLDIQGIEVFKNGVKIGEDMHEGFSGKAAKDNIYKFKINDYETGAAFTVKAKVRGEISNDSAGAVFLKKE